MAKSYMSKPPSMQKKQGKNNMKGLSASVMTGSRSNNNLSKSVDFDIGKFNLLKDEKNSDQFLPR